MSIFRSGNPNKYLKRTLQAATKLSAGCNLQISKTQFSVIVQLVAHCFETILSVTYFCFQLPGVAKLKSGMFALKIAFTLGKYVILNM